MHNHNVLFFVYKLQACAWAFSMASVIWHLRVGVAKMHVYNCSGALMTRHCQQALVIVSQSVTRTSGSCSRSKKTSFKINVRFRIMQIPLFPFPIFLFFASGRHNLPENPRPLLVKSHDSKIEASHNEKQQQVKTWITVGEKLPDSWKYFDSRDYSLQAFKQRLKTLKFRGWIFWLWMKPTMITEV